MSTEFDLGPDENKIIDQEIKKVMHGYIPYVKIALCIILVMDTIIYVLYNLTDLTEFTNTKRGLAFLNLVYIVFIYTSF